VEEEEARRRRRRRVRADAEEDEERSKKAYHSPETTSLKQRQIEASANKPELEEGDHILNALNALRDEVRQMKGVSATGWVCSYTLTRVFCILYLQYTLPSGYRTSVMPPSSTFSPTVALEDLRAVVRRQEEEINRLKASVRTEVRIGSMSTELVPA